MKKNLGSFLQSLACFVFVVIAIAAFFLFLSMMNGVNGSFSFGLFFGIILASFFMLLPVYTVGEIVKKLDEGVDVLNEINKKLDKLEK